MTIRILDRLLLNYVKAPMSGKIKMIFLKPKYSLLDIYISGYWKIKLYKFNLLPQVTGRIQAYILEPNDNIQQLPALLHRKY